MTPEEPVSEESDRIVAALERLNANVVASNEAIALSNQHLAESNERIAELSVFSQRSRRLIRYLGASLVLDVLLTLGLGLAFNQSSDAAHQARIAAAAAQALSVANKNSIYESCNTGNAVRLNDITLWTHILTLIPSQTAANAVSTAGLLLFVDKTFAPRDCGPQPVTG